MTHLLILCFSRNIVILYVYSCVCVCMHWYMHIRTYTCICRMSKTVIKTLTKIYLLFFSFHVILHTLLRLSPLYTCCMYTHTHAMYTMCTLCHTQYSQENSEFLQLNQKQLHQSSVNVGYSNIVYSNTGSSSGQRSGALISGGK